MKIEEYFNEGTPFQSMKPALSKTVVMRSLSIFQKKLLTQIIGEKLHICEIMDWTKDHKTTYTITDGENDFFDIKKETFNAIKQFFQYEQLCGSTDLSRRKWTIKIECFGRRNLRMKIQGNLFGLKGQELSVSMVCGNSLTPNVPQLNEVAD